MARAPTRRLPPSTAGRTPFVQIEMEQFASRLQHLRKAKGWSPSELARRVWGETTNKNTGRIGAKNRDRISVYEKARSCPDPHNLAMIAKALGVTPEYLGPNIAASTVEHQNPEFAVVMIADQVHLRVNKLVSWPVAQQVMELLEPDKAHAKPPIS